MRIDEIRPTAEPRRVMVDRNYATNPVEAEERFGIKPDLVFVRDDGWTLGAPEHLAIEAHDRWPTEWIAFYRTDDMKIRSINEFDA